MFLIVFGLTYRFISNGRQSSPPRITRYHLNQWRTKCTLSLILITRTYAPFAQVYPLFLVFLLVFVVDFPALLCSPRVNPSPRNMELPDRNYRSHQEDLLSWMDIDTVNDQTIDPRL